MPEPNRRSHRAKDATTPWAAPCPARTPARARNKQPRCNLVRFGHLACRRVHAIPPARNNVSYSQLPAAVRYTPSSYSQLPAAVYTGWPRYLALLKPPCAYNNPRCTTRATCHLTLPTTKQPYVADTKWRSVAPNVHRTSSALAFNVRPPQPAKLSRHLPACTTTRTFSSTKPKTQEPKLAHSNNPRPFSWTGHATPCRPDRRTRPPLQLYPSSYVISGRTFCTHEICTAISPSLAKKRYARCSLSKSNRVAWAGDGRLLCPRAITFTPHRRHLTWRAGR